MKRFMIPTMLLVLLTMLTACASAEQPVQTVRPMATLSPTQAPSLTDSLMNDLTPGNSNDDSVIDTAPNGGVPEAQGVTNVTNARKAMDQIEDELERLSEVMDAEVVVAGNTAAVALRFDKQYQGGVDERLEKMVQERIKSVVSGISNVVVTQDTSVFDQLNKLGERMESASDMAAIQSELETLVAKLKQKA